MECQGHSQISDIDTPFIHEYYAELSQRKNHRRGGGLSNNYLNLHLISLDKMLDYLRQKGKLILPALDIPHEEELARPVIPLTQEQVIKLYEATKRYELQLPALAKRDRAMLAIFYDCGLRRNEGHKLDIKDINFDTRLVHVRYGKNSQQRFVPFNAHTAKHLYDYRYEARARLLSYHSKESAFFISNRGGRLRGEDMARRLDYIQQHCYDTELKNLNLYLHLLRHSIATHLMQNGMPLENISRFLGHHSLSSTQVYTHLANEHT